MSDLAIELFSKRDGVLGERLGAIDAEIDRSHHEVVAAVVERRHDPAQLSWAIAMLQVSHYLKAPPSTPSTSESSMSHLRIEESSGSADGVRRHRAARVSKLATPGWRSSCGWSIMVRLTPATLELVSVTPPTRPSPARACPLGAGVHRRPAPQD